MTSIFAGGQPLWGCGSYAATALTPPVPPFDPVTLAWVAAVVANGGSVTSLVENAVDVWVKGGKSDGWFSKLDRFWLYAQDAANINEPEALTDIIATALATNVNSTPLTAAGYTGNGSTMYIDSGFNAATAGGQWTQNSACFLVWNNTAGGDNGAIAGLVGGTGSDTLLFPNFPGLGIIYGLNSSGNRIPGVGTGATGLYLINRTGAAAQTIDLNGTQQDSDTTSSISPSSSNAASLRSDGSTLSSRQISCLGFGGQLSGTDRTNINTRTRTLMTALGVP